ncbi:MAG: hypothetical protein O3A63_13440 [Proteobacteria bacterium]|nr:hypothetical protein [Pseudomonadota bacterium]
MNVRLLAILLLLSRLVIAAETLDEAESGFDLEWCSDGRCIGDESFDTAVFTDLSPVTSSENAVKLPTDEPTSTDE